MIDMNWFLPLKKSYNGTLKVRLIISWKCHPAVLYLSSYPVENSLITSLTMIWSPSFLSIHHIGLHETVHDLSAVPRGPSQTTAFAIQISFQFSTGEFDLPTLYHCFGVSRIQLQKHSISSQLGWVHLISTNHDNKFHLQS